MTPDEREALVDELARERFALEYRGTSATWETCARRVRTELREEAAWYVDRLAPPSA